MISIKKLFSVAAILALVFSPITPAFATAYYWDTTGSMVWETGANWSDSDVAGTTGVMPGAGDTAVFNQSAVNGNMVFQLGGDRALAGIIIKNTGTTLIDSNLVGTTRTLTIGTGGITVNGGAGAVTIGDLTTPQPLNLTLAGAQAWTNNSSNTLTIVNNVANGANLLTVTGSGDTTLNGVLGGGAGGLTKTGNGTLTLSGTNTYSGATAINGGTIKISGAGNLGDASATNTISMNGGKLESTANTYSLASNQAITLNGTGAIQVDGGTLTLPGAISLGSNTLTITTPTSASAGNTTLSGVISGVGGNLAITNGANVTLSGAASNTFTGTTTMTPAAYETQRLTLSKTGGAVAIAGNMTLDNNNSPFLSMTQSNQFAATSVISWITSDPLVAGTARFQMQGNNQTVGGISSTDSTAAVIQNTPWGGGAGVWADCTLTINTAAGQSYTWQGMLRDKDNGLSTGTLAITKSGTGTQILYGNALSYTGKTTISAGTLQLGTGTSGGTLSTSEIDFTGGTFQYGGTNTQDISALIKNSTSAISINTNSNNVTFASALAASNTGGLTKTGAGTLTLTGNNVYTGTTTITAGTLAYGASVTSASAHTNNSILTLGTNTLTITGANAYTQGAASTLNVSITNSTTFGNIVATGADATVDDTSIVNVTVGSQYIAGGTAFKIVDGKSTSAAVEVPTTITDSSYVLSFAGTSSSGDLILTAVRTNAYNTLSTNNSNDSAVGAALEQAGKNGATGDMLTVLNTLDQMGSAQEITNAISTMTPDVSSGAAEASRTMTNQGFTMVSNRLGGGRASGFMGTGVSAGEMLNGIGVWIQGLGSHMKQDERKGVQGYSANLWGTSIGADKLIDKHFRAGLAGGYGWSRVKSKTPGSPSDDINSFQATAYGSYDSLDLCEARQRGKNSREAVRNQGDQFWYVDGMVSFTQNNYDSRREIWVTPTSGRIAKAEHYGQQYSTNFEGGYTFTFEETKALEVTPFAGLGYNFLYMNKYKEKGADALNLTVDGEGFHQLEQSLGTKLAYPMIAEKVGTFIPSVKAAWLYDYIGDRFETEASFAGGGSSFKTKGAKPAKNGMLFGAELAFLNKGNVTLTGNWDMEIKDQFMSNTYYGTARYDF